MAERLNIPFYYKEMTELAAQETGMDKEFLYASKEYRVNKIMEMYGDSREDARNYMKNSDQTRATYYRNISGQNWRDSYNYSLCVDASMGMEKCVELICSLTRESSV